MYNTHIDHKLLVKSPKTQANSHMPLLYIDTQCVYGSTPTMSR